MKILASKLRQIGDGVLWTSALQGLRAAYPAAHIELLTPGFGPELYASAPWANRVHVVESGAFALPRKLWELRKNQYDLFLGFHANTSLCRWAPLVRAQDKVLHHYSWNHSPRANTRPIPRAGELEHVILRDWRNLEALGIKFSPGPTRLFVTDTERSQASELLRARGAVADKRLVLLPGARAATRRYPEDLWKQLAQKIAASRAPGSVIVIADSEQARLWNLPEFVNAHGLILCSDLTLRQVLAVLSVCEQAVGNDSGLIHAAAALGLRTVSIFGAGCFGDFRPLQTDKDRFVRIAVDCRLQGPRDNEPFQYCTLTYCDHHSCMRKIPHETILSSI